MTVTKDVLQTLHTPVIVGEDCGLCKDTRWSLQRKQFPAAPATQ